jgi:hypothetical protein
MSGQPAAFFTYFPTGWLVGVFLAGLFIWLVSRTVVRFKRKSHKDLLNLGTTIMAGVALLWYFTMNGVYDSWLPESVYWIDLVICVLGIIVTLFVWVLGYFRWTGHAASLERAHELQKSS